MIVLTAVGGGALIFSLVLPSKDYAGWVDILRAVGLAFFPTGIVSYLLTRYAGEVTDMRITEAVRRTIGERFEKNIDEMSKGVVEDLSKKWNESAGLMLKEIQSMQEAVDKGINSIETNMRGWSPLIADCSKLGVEGVYLTRTKALEAFAWFLDAEIHKALKRDPACPARIWFVSSSIKGFINAATDKFNGKKMMEAIANSGCEVRILMTDVGKADLRATQEGRASGEIPSEIKMYLAMLKRLGIKRESIKLYPGTPTVFGVATMDRILLNPYPYETEAFGCFSLIVHKTLDPQADIFSQYSEFHFERPWKRSVEIAQTEWEKLS